MDIRIPNLSEGVNSGTVVAILVKVGDRVERDQTVLELETDKAVAPIPSPEAGVVSRINVKEGEKVAVGHLVLTLDGAGAAGSSGAAPAAQVPTQGQGGPSAASSSAGYASPARVAQPSSAPASAVGYQYQSASGFPPAASPTIRRMAMDLGIDLTRVRGTESGGRISLGDLRNYVQHLQSLLNAPAGSAAPAPAVSAAPAAPAAAPKVSIDFSKWGPVEKKALTSLRKTIGRRMQESWQTVPDRKSVV